MSKSKYIVYKGPGKSFKSAIVFDDTETHAEIAVCLKSEIVSAGFVELIPNPNEDFGIRIRVYGESVSLGLKALNGDEKIIRRALGLNY